MRRRRQAQEKRGGCSNSEAQNFSFTSDDFDDEPPRELQKRWTGRFCGARFCGSTFYWQHLRISILDDYVLKKGSESASKDFLKGPNGSET
jgi:hypothetical protein